MGSTSLCAAQGIPPSSPKTPREEGQAEGQQRRPYGPQCPEPTCRPSAPLWLAPSCDPDGPVPSRRGSRGLHLHRGHQGPPQPCQDGVLMPLKFHAFPQSAGGSSMSPVPTASLGTRQLPSAALTGQVLVTQAWAERHWTGPNGKPAGGHWWARPRRLGPRGQWGQVFRTGRLCQARGFGSNPCTPQGQRTPDSPCLPVPLAAPGGPSLTGMETPLFGGGCRPSRRSPHGALLYPAAFPGGSSSLLGQQHPPIDMAAGFCWGRSPPAGSVHALQAGASQSRTWYLILGEVVADGELVGALGSWETSLPRPDSSPARGKSLLSCHKGVWWGLRGCTFHGQGK